MPSKNTKLAVRNADVLWIRQTITFQECTLNKNRNEQTCGEQRSNMMTFSQILHIYLFMEWLILLKPSNPVPPVHCYWLQSPTIIWEKMKHGSKVAINMRDQYTDAPYGLANKTHTKMWTFVVFCHFFNPPQLWQIKMPCGVMEWWCGQAFALDSTHVWMQTPELHHVTFLQDTAHLHIARTCRGFLRQEGFPVLTGCRIHQRCHLSNTFAMFWIGVSVFRMNMWTSWEIHGRHVTCHIVSKAGTFSNNFYKQASFPCLQAFSLFTFSTDSRPVGNVHHLPFRDMFHPECQSGQKPFASVEQTESQQSVNFWFYLFEYLFCCDLEAHQNWISSVATLRGSTNTCGAVTDLCERAARSSK